MSTDISVNIAENYVRKAGLTVPVRVTLAVMTTEYGAKLAYRFEMMALLVDVKRAGVAVRAGMGVVHLPGYPGLTVRAQQVKGVDGYTVDRAK